MRVYGFLFIILFSSIFYSGCITSSAVIYDENTKYSATNPKKVKIFRNEPPQPYIALGEVTAGNNSHMSWLENSLRKKAAAIGGDAVIITNVTNSAVGSVNQYGGSLITKHQLNGVVIKFKNSENLPEVSAQNKL